MSVDARVQQFKRSAEALNKQFVQWCSSQVDKAPNRLLAAGVADYLRHAAKLRLAFGDIMHECAEDHQPTTDARNGRQYAPLLSLVPMCHSKTIHFIRHGEGWHNVGIANPDAAMTTRGWAQAHALGNHMLRFDATRQVRLVVISPLMRALETAAGVFGVHLDSNYHDDTSSPGALMMVEQSEVREVRSAHAAVRCRPGMRYLVHELCRERRGPSRCDSRRPRSQAASAFPALDFSLVNDEEDQLWQPGHVEPEEEVVLRGRQFLQWLMTLPDTNIAVVTHSAFLWFTLLGFGVEFVRPVRERLQRWYENCEMRSVVLSDGGAMALPLGRYEDSDFAGGHAALEPQQQLMEAAVG